MKPKNILEFDANMACAAVTKAQAALAKRALRDILYRIKRQCSRNQQYQIEFNLFVYNITFPVLFKFVVPHLLFLGYTVWYPTTETVGVSWANTNTKKQK